MIALLAGVALAGDPAPVVSTPAEAVVPTTEAGVEAPVEAAVEPAPVEVVAAPPAPPAPVARAPQRIDDLPEEPAPVARRPRSTGWSIDDVGLAGLLVAGAAAAGVGWWLKNKKPPVVSARSPLAVVDRVAAGTKSELLLIDVVGADGERRRLLIGTGGGSPTLVADLGGRELTVDEPLELEPEVPIAPERAERIRAFVATGGPTSTPRVAADRYEPRVDRTPERLPRQRTPAQAKSMVDEVLARRRSVR